MIALGEEEFQYQAAVLFQFLVAGLHHLPVAGGMGAGGDEVPFFFYLDQAHPAGADISQSLEVAQGRELNPVGHADIQDAVALFPLALFAVYR